MILAIVSMYLVYAALAVEVDDFYGIVRCVQTGLRAAISADTV
jgi:hypothetical protein